MYESTWCLANNSLSDMHPFLLVAGVVLAKKAVGVSLYYAAKKYGWSRVYRRALELNKQVTPLGQQARIQSSIRQVMVMPTKAAQLIHDSEIMKFVSRSGEYIRGRGGLQAAALARVVTSFIHAPGKWLDEVLPAIEREIDEEQLLRKTTLRPTADAGAQSGSTTTSRQSTVLK